MDMRIEELLQASMTETKKTAEREKTEDFGFTLQKVDKEGLRERLSSILEEVTKAGEKLSKHMDIRDMKNYRGLVKKFMNEIVNNSHEFSRENFLDRRGRHRVYGIIKKVDENLDNLAQELMSSEKTSLSILQRVDEIRGLLIDITL